jgi:hypothetical protein
MRRNRDFDAIDQASIAVGNIQSPQTDLPTLAANMLNFAEDRMAQCAGSLSAVHTGTKTQPAQNSFATT